MSSYKPSNYGFFLYDILAVLVYLSRVRFTFFHQLWLSMEPHEQASINAPPHSEARFCFELGLGCKGLILTMRARRDWDSKQGSQDCKPNVLRLS